MKRCLPKGWVIKLTDFKLKPESFKKKSLLFIGAAAGLVLILIGIFWGGGEKKQQQDTEAAVWGEDTLAYTSQLEEKTKKLIENIKGVSSADVMIMLDSSNEYIYASNSSVRMGGANESQSKESERDYLVLKDKDGSEYPVLVKKKTPSVKGVAVVCNNKNSVIELEIITLVSTLFEIPTNKIYVYS